MWRQPFPAIHSVWGGVQLGEGPLISFAIFYKNFIL